MIMASKTYYSQSVFNSEKAPSQNHMHCYYFSLIVRQNGQINLKYDIRDPISTLLWIGNHNAENLTHNSLNHRYIHAYIFDIVKL